MSKAKKCLRLRLLDSGVLLCLILGFSSLARAEFAVIGQHMISTDIKDPCSIVKIHAISEELDGTLLHQEGHGWIAMSAQKGGGLAAGVVVPFHVVVNAKSVFAECRGNFYELSSATVDAEKDLAHLGFEDIEGFKKGHLSMALVEITDQKIRELAYPTDHRKLVGQMMTPTEIKKQLPDVLNSMVSFGVVMSPEKKQVASVLVSAFEQYIIRGVVDKSQAGTANLIRIENFGVKPGISGSVLFGVPFHGQLIGFDNVRNKTNYSVPIEIIPKLVLGMVVKTKLNGAETVAISLPDIVEFLEGPVRAGTGSVDYPLQVRYHKVTNQEKHTELQSFLYLRAPDENLTVQEICSAEFKSSADFKILTDKTLAEKWEEQKKKDEPRRKNLEGQLNDFIHRPRPIEDIQLQFRDFKKLQRKSGGGEYGEGGNGFEAKGSQFLTSLTTMPEVDPGTLNFKTMSEVSAFGLYLRNQTCANPGLRVGERMINAFAMPGEGLQRMTTYEDVRRLYAKYQGDTVLLLKKYGTMERNPFFTFEKKWDQNLTLPLGQGLAVSSADSDWSPAGKKYFKEKLRAVAKSPSFVEISNKRIFLNTRMKGISNSEEKMGWVQLRYENNQWQGRFALNAQCEVNLKPESFRQIHPWLAEYSDGQTELKIEMGTQDRLLGLYFHKVGCADMKDLALGELEIYPNAADQIIVGSRRMNFYPQPIDLEVVRKAIEKFEKSVQESEQSGGKK